MDIAALQRELSSLTPEYQDRMAGFLMSLKMKREGVDTEISKRLDDTDEGNWVSWNDVKGSFSDDG